MKGKIQFILFLLLTISIIQSCSTEENVSRLEFELNTQEEVDAFKSSGQKIDKLVLSGPDITSVKNLYLPRIKEFIVENTSIVDLECRGLGLTEDSFIIRSNPELRTIKDLGGYIYSGGILEIKDNPELVSIEGLLSMKNLLADLVITGNHNLGQDRRGKPETYGFNVLLSLSANRALLGNLTLEDNHPDAATKLSDIGKIAKQIAVDYVFTTNEECLNVVPEGEEALSIVCEGEAINNLGFDSLKNKFKSVRNSVVLKNTSVTELTQSGFFGNVECKGSIYLIDNKNLARAVVFHTIPKIMGDFVCVNSPKERGDWTDFENIVEVAGDLIVKNIMFNPGTFRSLQKVGGDFIIGTQSPLKPKDDLWNFAPMTSFSEVGGDFVIKGFPIMNSLKGFSGIKKIGGNVEIGPCGDIPIKTVGNALGLDLVRKWVDTGVLQPTASVKLYSKDGKEIPFETVQ